MDYSIVIGSLILQILLVFVEVKYLRWRALLAPGFYYGIVWTLGILGNMVIDAVGMFKMPHSEYINELHLFVGFTALCFIFFTYVYRKKIPFDNYPRLEFFKSYKLFVALSSIVLLISLGNFISSGANFNMGAARIMMHENVKNQSVWVGYGQAMSVILSIYAGYVLGVKLFHRRKIYRGSIVLLFFPLIANLFFSIYLGGRVDFVYGFANYMIGFVFVLPIKTTLKESWKILKKGLIIVACILLFITYVNVQREQEQTSKNEHYERITNGNPLIKAFYGPMFYVQTTFEAYQYRRIDAVDLNNLGYGRYSLNGFINWTLPFAGRFGLDNFSIADAFDIKYNPQETYDGKRFLFFCTHSCYIPLVKDFGPTGTFFAIFFLVWVAQWLFVKIQQKKVIKYACSLFLYFIFLQYWIKSNYYGTLSNSVFVTLYGFLLVDLCNMFVKGKRNYETR